MLSPVLEIYVVWHPDDGAGRAIADEIIAHFHGTAFSGLIGGAVEVFVRSEPWSAPGDAPRKIFTPISPPPNDVAAAMFTAVVPILGNGLAGAVEDGGPWSVYLSGIVAAQKSRPKHIGLFPYRLHNNACSNTQLGKIMGAYQTIAASAPHQEDTSANARCRDLSQALAQFVAGDVGLQLIAFISHTKRVSAAEAADVLTLIELVKSVIASTHLKDYFDARDLQPGTDWANTLTKYAGISAFLALRTDLYASREWCQREMLTAKRAGMPIVILDALGYSEERGSFLMDHVPRTPIRTLDQIWSRRDVYRALNILVDECLKRALWQCQQELAKSRSEVAVSWWAPHAPEPVTFIDWIEANGADIPAGSDVLRILHPDPPLGPDEREVLEQILRFGRSSGSLDVMTPRQLAARGG
ncbi:hypothetical protein ABIB90_001543 [Bradyrhizobium sp. JR4.1]|uniref:hypothetical protein n=1 Tax=Bradyrhizobium sp. JR4.1 TaxID=3156372 RepID=UPI0033995B39